MELSPEAPPTFFIYTPFSHVIYTCDAQYLPTKIMLCNSYACESFTYVNDLKQTTPEGKRTKMLMKPFLSFQNTNFLIYHNFLYMNRNQIRGGRVLILQMITGFTAGFSLPRDFWKDPCNTKRHGFCITLPVFSPYAFPHN